MRVLPVFLEQTEKPFSFDLKCHYFGAAIISQSVNRHSGRSFVDVIAVSVL